MDLPEFAFTISDSHASLLIDMGANVLFDSSTALGTKIQITTSKFMHIYSLITRNDRICAEPIFWQNQFKRYNTIAP